MPGCWESSLSAHSRLDASDLRAAPSVWIALRSSGTQPGRKSRIQILRPLSTLQFSFGLLEKFLREMNDALYSVSSVIMFSAIVPSSLWLFTLLLTIFPLQVQAQSSLTLPSPLICEDTIASLPPFIASSAPCLLGCGAPSPTAAGTSLTPGYVNETDIPYCEARCVRPAITPDQFSRAPTCHDQCQWQRAQGSVENYAWCIYWCLEGGIFESLVKSVTCVPSLGFGSAYTTVTQEGGPVTLSGRLHELYQLKHAVRR
jgi:hypothetical protein